MKSGYFLRILNAKKHGSISSWVETINLYYKAKSSVFSWDHEGVIYYELLELVETANTDGYRHRFQPCNAQGTAKISKKATRVAPRQYYGN